MSEVLPATPAVMTSTSARRRGVEVLRSIGGRLLQAVIVAFGVVTVTFFLIHVIPGDPARQMLGPQASPAAVATLQEQLNLNEPMFQQYLHFLSEAVRGQLGTSLAHQGLGVTDLILESVGPTLVLIALTLLFSVPLGIGIGLWAGTTGSRALDGGLRFGTVLALAMPPFFLGPVLILLVSLDLGIAPAGGWAESYPERLRYLWLPALTLSALMIPIIARAVRQRARVIMRSRFVEAAVVRGISRRRLIFAHVLPNSALPAITLIGLNAGILFSGAVVVETLFGLPGIGSLLLSSVQSRDYPVVQGIAILAGTFVVLCNFAADAVIRFVDPRTRT